MNTKKILFDLNKKGTLIISTYRSGTHFLHDYIADVLGNEHVSLCDEICNDNTINQLIKLTSSDNNQYKVAILNNKMPHYYLFNNKELLQQWHVVRLTRNDKSHHFISHWFWKQNFKDNDFSIDVTDFIFQHHGTDNQTYVEHMPKKTQFDIADLIVWLQEQLSIFHIKSDVSIDYSELKDYSSNNIQWKPNQYNNIRLEDLFTNHDEIKILLDGFTPQC